MDEETRKELRRLSRRLKRLERFIKENYSEIRLKSRYGVT